MVVLESLRGRLAELSDLGALQELAQWDLLVMMPEQGGPGRAEQLGSLASLTHERATAEEIGDWLAELDRAELDDLDRDIVRLARRDWERARRVPPDLAAALAHASAAGQECWQVARANDDFAAFARLCSATWTSHASTGIASSRRGRADMRRSSTTTTSACERRSYAACSASWRGSSRRWWPRRRSTRRRARSRCPSPHSEAAVTGTLRRLGVEGSSWRVDVSAHPFSVWMGRRDTRVTTRYRDGDVESLMSSLHEYGHALYERQIDPTLERTNLGRGTSMSIHESQSKLWENHVAPQPRVRRGVRRRAGSAAASRSLRASCTRASWE